LKNADQPDWLKNLREKVFGLFLRKTTGGAE